ncbi:MAG TPA: hypothetical protein VLT62_15615 [Candidatus Methylomirabilis sp.]|nr:hypothetical protein [Candidatus Methylomirabilis sp.]
MSGRAAALSRTKGGGAWHTERLLLALQRQYGNRYVRQVLTLSLRENDDAGASDVAPDDRFLYQNGTTTCAFPSGTPSVAINNTDCSAPCTTRHENVHAADIRSCCAKAGTAYRAATTDADRTSVENRFYGWLGANRSWFECRAYAESVRCADEEMASRNCSSPTPANAACCATLSAYRADKLARRVSNCAAAGGSLSACPFP